MTKVKDGFYHQLSSKIGDNDYLLKAGGGYIGVGNGEYMVPLSNYSPNDALYARTSRNLLINGVTWYSNWYWSGQGGQPAWLWGSNDGTNMYVWDPSNFRVSYANSAGYADSAGYATSAGSVTYSLNWTDGDGTSQSYNGSNSKTINKLTLTTSASSWLGGQNTPGQAALHISDSTDTGSYWPWFIHKNTSSGRMFSLGVLNNSFYILGSTTSRTSNSYDYCWRFDLSNGWAYGNFENADTVDGYHAYNLWRSDGAAWNPGANVTLNQSGNGQEWSFDIYRNGYTGGYWHVWDSSYGSMLQVTADDGKVRAPYGFVGNLSGTADYSNYTYVEATSTSDWMYPNFTYYGNTYRREYVYTKLRFQPSTGHLSIVGNFDGDPTKYDDGNDRPGISITGDYPQLSLIAGRVGNSSHGAVLSIGAYDSSGATSGTFKTFRLGTAGYNATWLDLAYGTHANVHDGVAGWNASGNGIQIMRFHNDRTVYNYGTAYFGVASYGAAYYHSGYTVYSYDKISSYSYTYGKSVIGDSTMWNWTLGVNGRVGIGTNDATDPAYLNLPYNTFAINFRPGGSWTTGFYYGTWGNEFISLATQQSVTSIIFANGYHPNSLQYGSFISGDGGVTYGQNYDVIQIKQNCMNIGGVWTNGVGPDYKLKVNGRTRINYTGGDCDPSLVVTATSNGSWRYAAAFLAPNLTSGYNVYVPVGTEMSTRNAIGLTHYTYGSGNTLNYAAMEIWGVGNIQRWYYGDMRTWFAGRVDVDGTLWAQGHIARGSEHIISPKGGSYTSNAYSETGYIIVRFPHSLIYCMMSVWIDIYSYSTQHSCSIHCGAYTYDSSFGHAPFARCIGRNLKVRFCYDSDYYYIAVGESDSVWYYPKFMVRDMLVGYSRPVSEWLDKNLYCYISSSLPGNEYTSIQEYIDTVNNNNSRYLRKDTNDTSGVQYTFTCNWDHAIQIGTIRGYGAGSCGGEYIHLYERVHIGSPNGWGSRNAPSYGLSTYGGAWLATDTGNVGIGNTDPSQKLDVNGSIILRQSSSQRNAGIIGWYDYTKAAAIWAMGASYQIASDGSSLGNLYGAAYVYEGQAGTGGRSLAYGHQFVWADAGDVRAALGYYGVWARRYVVAEANDARIIARAQSDSSYHITLEANWDWSWPWAISAYASVIMRGYYGSTYLNLGVSGQQVGIQTDTAAAHLHIANGGGFLYTGDGSLKLYEIDGGYSCGSETIGIQTCFDGVTNPDSHSYVNDYWTRCFLALQPRNGVVGIGCTTYNSTMNNNGTYKLIVNGSARFGTYDLDNSTWKNTISLFANQSSETWGEGIYNEVAWGIGFKRQWSSGSQNVTSAGIYAVGSSGWRTGLAFRVKDNQGADGYSHDRTALWLSPAGRVGINTGDPGQRLHVWDGLLAVTCNGYTLTMGNQNSGWTHITTSGTHFWFNPSVAVDGNVYPYYANNNWCGTSGNYWYMVSTAGVLHPGYWSSSWMFTTDGGVVYWPTMSDGRYVLKSGDSMTGQLSVCSASENAYPNYAAIEVRERGRGTTGITHNYANAPRIGFHWGNRYWANFAYFDGYFKFMNEACSGYAATSASNYSLNDYSGSYHGRSNNISGLAGEIWFGGNFHIDSQNGYNMYFNYYNPSTIYFNGSSYWVNSSGQSNMSMAHLLINSSTWWSNWYWSGQGGQPTWLWGSNDGSNMYVWNPSNFSVNYANSAGYSNYLNARYSSCGNIGTNQFFTWYDWNNTGNLGTYFHGFWCGSPDGNIGFEIAYLHQERNWLHMRTYDYGSWNNWVTILTSANWSSYISVSGNYLPLSGGTMTGPIGIGTEQNSYRWMYGTTRTAGIKYDYAGNEALIISSGTYANSALKLYSGGGITLTDSSGQYTTGTPAIDCKSNCVAINYNWGTSSPGYNLYVNGTTNLKGNTDVSGNLYVSGTATISNAFTVYSTASISGLLSANGGTKLSCSTTSSSTVGSSSSIYNILCSTYNGAVTFYLPSSSYVQNGMVVFCIKKQNGNATFYSSGTKLNWLHRNEGYFDISDSLTISHSSHNYKNIYICIYAGAWYIASTDYTL